MVNGVQNTTVGKRLERRFRAYDCPICPEDWSRGVASCRSACSVPAMAHGDHGVVRRGATSFVRCAVARLSTTNLTVDPLWETARAFWRIRPVGRPCVNGNPCPLGRIRSLDRRARLGCVRTKHYTVYLVDPSSNICLSQRLSHACLSISTCTVKLRMAH